MSTTETQQKKSIVIIGGGYAGVALARELDGHAQVTLVDCHDVFFHKVASLRASVVESWTTAPFIPYSHLLKYGTFVHGKASGIDTDKHEVTLEDGKVLSYDIAVIATGSEYAEPANFKGGNALEAGEAFQKRQQDIANAKKIIIVGGGPVGVELAGEIIARHPGKDLTLVQNVDVLLAGDHTKELGHRAQRVLEAKGVHILLNEMLTPGTEPGTFTKKNGESISSDLNFIAIGGKMNTGWIGKDHPHWLDEKGKVKVDVFLRVEGKTSVFAIGDSTNVKEPKLALSAVAQARLTATNIKMMIAGKQNALQTYVPFTGREMVVPIGPYGGVTVLPIGRDGMVFGSLVTWFLKSRTLFIPKYRRMLGFFSIGLW